MLHIQQNDTALIERIKKMTADEISEIVKNGQYNVTTLTAENNRRYYDVALAGDWVMAFYQTRDRSSPDYGRVRVTLRSSASHNRRAMQIGEQNYAQACGLSNDHAYNWRNSYIPTRYRLLPAIITLSKDEELKKYLIDNRPTDDILLTPARFSAWLLGAPTTDPEIVSLDRADYSDLHRLAVITLREALSFEERHEIRESYREAAAAKKGEKYLRKPCPEPKPFDAKPKYQPKQKSFPTSKGYADPIREKSPVERMADNAGNVDPMWAVGMNEVNGNRKHHDNDDNRKRGSDRRRQGNRKPERSRRDDQWN